MWLYLAAFFTLTVARLFSYLQNARTVNESHLATAMSIYLLLGMLWFALYNVIEIFSPDAILHKSVTAIERQSESTLPSLWRSWSALTSQRTARIHGLVFVAARRARRSCLTSTAYVIAPYARPAPPCDHSA